MITILSNDLLSEIAKYLVISKCFVFGTISKRFHEFYHSNIFRTTIIHKIKLNEYNLIDFDISQINYLYQRSLYNPDPEFGVKNKVNLNGVMHTLLYDGKVGIGSRDRCIAGEIKSIISIGRYPIFLTQAGTLINYEKTLLIFYLFFWFWAYFTSSMCSRRSRCNG